MSPQHKQTDHRIATHLLLLLGSSGFLGASLLLALALLQEGLRNQNLVLSGNGTAALRLVRGPTYCGMEKSAGGEL